jgi:hypothetical protein
MLVTLKRRCCSIVLLRHVHDVYISQLSSQCVCRDGSDTSDRSVYKTPNSKAINEIDQHHHRSRQEHHQWIDNFILHTNVFFSDLLLTFTVIRFFKTSSSNSPSRGKRFVSLARAELANCYCMCVCSYQQAFIVHVSGIFLHHAVEIES